MATTITEIDWLKHFDAENIKVELTETGSRAYVELNNLTTDLYAWKYAWKDGARGYRIYLDKLPTTAEEAKLYFYQLLSELVSRLQFTKTVTIDYFGSQEFTERVLQLTDLVAMITRLMGPGPGTTSRELFYRMDSPYQGLDQWLNKVYSLTFRAGYVYLMQQQELFPVRLMFWR